MILILLADDHRVVRASVRDLLEREPQFRVAAEADGGREAVRLAHELRPDVVLMDITMPDLGGIEATRLILADDPGIKVIALTVHADGHMAAEAFKAGAAGYLLKSDAGKELPDAVRSVLAGRRYTSHNLRDVPPDPADGGGSPPAAVASLSADDLAILRLLAEGQTPGEIGRTLHLGGDAVQACRLRVKRIIAKLSVLSADEAPASLSAAGRPDTAPGK